MKRIFISQGFSSLISMAMLFLIATHALAQVEPPEFVPQTSDAAVALDVTVSCPTAGAEIRYTLNGADPTVFDPTVVSGATVRIARSSVLKASARLGGVTSAVTTKDYRITGSVVSGYQHGMALSVSGRMWSWGNQASGRLGNGNTANLNVPVPAKVLHAAGFFENGSAISAGYDHSVVIDQAGAVWAFGDNTEGQLGNNSTTDSALPVRVLKSTTAGDFLTGCVDIDTGENFSIILSSTGQPLSWGVTDTGRIGSGVNNGAPRKFAGPVQRGDLPSYPNLTGIRSVAAGNSWGLGREPNSKEQAGQTGRVWVWGHNHVGQLGRGNTSGTFRAYPMKLNATIDMTDAWDVDAGEAHSVVLRWSDTDPNLQGTVWSCGKKDDGRLGNGSTSAGNATYPVQAIKEGGGFLTGIEQISAGAGHTLALDADGHVWAWGNNGYGQLGDGTDDHNGHARMVKDAAGIGILDDIVLVSAGGDGIQGSSMALAKDGTIWVWGRNDHGQLGNGTTSLATLLPVAQAQNHIDEGEPSLAMHYYNDRTTDFDRVEITASPYHTGEGGMAEIDRVEIFLNGVLSATLTTGNLLHVADNLPEGDYQCVGVVYDVNGVTAMSSPLTFEITNEQDAEVPGEGENVNTPRVLAAVESDPDGLGLPSGLRTGLIGRWDCEVLKNDGSNKHGFDNKEGSDFPLQCIPRNITLDPLAIISKGAIFDQMEDHLSTSGKILDNQKSLSISMWIKFPENYIQEKPNNFSTTLFSYNQKGEELNPALIATASRGAPGSQTQKISVSRYVGLVPNPYFSVDLVKDDWLDQGKWVHVCFVKNSDTDNNTHNSYIYINGVLRNSTLISVSAWTSTATGSFCFGKSKPDSLNRFDTFTGTMDRLRIYNKRLSDTQVQRLYRQDADGDGLWDVTEKLYSNTEPFIANPPDADNDGLLNTTEQDIGTNPFNFDSDGDLLPDDFEHFAPCLDPNRFETYSEGTLLAKEGDPDNDGLSNIEEYIHGTNPCSDNSDDDPDDILDGEEVSEGSDPLDNQDQPFDPADYYGDPINDQNIPHIGNLGVNYNSSPDEYSIKGRFGDDSLSSSERWKLKLDGKRSINQVNREFGEVENFNFNLSGQHIWKMSVEHVSSSREDPDYDYDLSLDEEDGHKGFIFLDSPDGQALAESDNEGIIGSFEIDEESENYWVDKRGFLIPTKSSSYSKSFSGSDAVGPRYRKIALNGRPMPDEKPEEEEETEVHREETYVDAFDLSLHHDTSFTHLPLAASDLIIEANASSRETTWSNRAGLRPREELTSPFGVGWSSNLCSYVEVVQTIEANPTDPISVNVVDEGGRGQRFATNNLQTFQPWPSSTVDKKTYLNRLVKSGANLVLYKKYGNTLTYEPSTAWFAYSTDRLEGSEAVSRHSYWRLSKVVDRYGNTVNYTYGSTNISLIPQKIESLNHANQFLSIDRSADGRRISKITDAQGKSVDFTYTKQNANNSITEYTRLDSIKYPDDTIQAYSYELASYSEVVESKTTIHYHANLKSITDRRGNITTFNYAPDTTKFVYSASGSGKTEFAVTEGEVDSTLSALLAAEAKEQLAAMNDTPPDNQQNFRMQYGLPRLISSVVLPGGNGTSEFVKTADSRTSYGETLSAVSKTEVTDVLQNKTYYDFGGIHGEIVDMDGTFEEDSASVSVEWLIYYLTLDVHHGGRPGATGHLGSETFEFNLESGLSLSSMTDFSGNETKWTFGSPLPTGSVLNFPGVEGFMSQWADPTSKTDALDRTESYEYGAFRVMSKSIDVHGTITDTSVDFLGRRTSLTVTDANVGILKKEEYGYTSAFPAFMTKKTVKAFANRSGKSWEKDLVTEYVPDSRGRLWKEIVDPGGLNLETIHSYDLNNNKRTTTDPKQNITTFHYDALNRIYRTDLPATKTESGFQVSSKYFAFDKNGAKAVEVDENGNWSIFQRDALNRVTAVIRDMDGSGRPSWNTLFLIDDSALNASSVTGNDDIVTRTGYNGVSYPIRKVDARGFATVTVTDALQRPIHVFGGVPSSQGTDFGSLASLASASRSVNRTDLSYEDTVSIGGTTYSTSPGSSGFSSEGFKPTRSIRHDAVRENATGDDSTFTTVAVYDEVYRPLATSEIFNSGSMGEKRTITAYGNFSAGKESLVTTMTDALGTVTETLSDGLGRAISVTQAKDTLLERQTETFYSSTGLPWKSVDWLSRATESDYDRAGRPTHVRQPDPATGQITGNSPVIQTIYDNNGNVTATIDPLERRTDTDHDGRNRPWSVQLTAVTDARNPGSPVPNVRPTSLTYYDPVGNITLATDARGSSSRNFHDRANRVIATRTNPVTGTPSADLGSPASSDITSSTSPDKGGLILAATDGNGNVTRNAYDSLGRLIATATDPTNGNPTDPSGSGFDAASFRSGTGILVTNLFDDSGNLIEVADGKNQRTGFTYDGLGRKTRTIWDPGTTLEKTETFIFNALVQTGRTDPMARFTLHTHDVLHRLQTVVYSPATGEITSHHLDNQLRSYDAGDRLLSVTYPNEPASLRNTGSTHDALDRVTSETSAGVTHQFPLYDAAGNRLHTVYGNTGRALVSTYDALNRLDTCEERDTLATPSGRSTFYAYDLTGKITRKTLPNGNHTDTSYDYLGRTLGIEERTNTNALVSSFDYSVAVSPWPSSYDAVANVLRVGENYSLTGMRGREVSNTYDLTYRLITEITTAVEPTHGGLTTRTEIQESNYTYDKSHNKIKRTRQGSVDESDYQGIDENGLMISIGGLDEVHELGGLWYYFGNADNGANSNQMISSGNIMNPVGTNPIWTYTYDANGNRKTAVTGTKTDTYTWDPENRLTGLSFNSGAEGTTGSYNYGYDYRSRRVVRDEGTTTGVKIAASFSGGSSVQEYQFREIHDRYQDADFDGTANLLEYAFGGDPLSGNGNATYSPPYPVSGFAEWAAAAILNRLTVAEIIAYRDARTTLKTQIIRGSDWGGGIGGILYTIRDGARSYNAYNSRGDVVSTTDASGAATWQASYEAFGKRTAEQGDNAERQRANTKEEDPTGLLNEGFRYRDLETGVFISRDPLGFVDGPNVYTYVRQNPWTMFDPYGLESHGPVIDSVWNFGAGAGKAVGGTIYSAKEAFGFAVGGSINAVGAAFGHRGSREMGADKLDTLTEKAQGIGHAVAHPVDTGKAVVAEYKGKLQTSGGAGEIVGEVGVGVVTGGIFKIADKANDVSKIAGISGATARQIDAANSASVTKMPALPAGEAPYQLKLFPDEAYSRTGHYGNTPTAAQRASVPPGMEFDHNPTLVKHYYEGDGAGGLPGFNLTQTERLQYARSPNSGSAATPSQQRAQGGAAAQYSKQKKKENGL